MKYIVIILLFIFSAIACRANAFQWKVEKFDIWGRAILVSEDGTHTATPEKSRKKLCAIYHSSDFWNLVPKTIESRDSGGLSIITAIWFDIASGDDRERIIHDVYAGTVGEIPDRTNPYISKRVFDKVKLISDTNSDPRLIYALSIMLLDYYDFPEILSFFGRGKDDFPSFVYVKLAAMWEYSGVRWNAFEDYSQIIYFFHFLPKMFPEWCLYFDILSREYEIPNWSYSEKDFAKIEKVLGKDDSALRFSRALRDGNEEEFLNLAYSHFYPAYLRASDYCFKKKMYQDSAYFYYLYLRHPANFYRFITIAAPDKVREKLILPSAEHFCESLLLSKRYEDLMIFISYFKVMAGLSNGGLFAPEVETLTNKVKRQLLQRGEKLSQECETIGYRSGSKGGYFYIQNFEERYQKELSELEKNK